MKFLQPWAEKVYQWSNSCMVSKEHHFNQETHFLLLSASTVVNDIPQADNHIGPQKIFPTSLDLSKFYSPSRQNTTKPNMSHFSPMHNK